MKKQMMFLLSVSLVTLLSVRIAFAAPLNGSTLDQISGVAIHFTNPDVATFKRMKSIGIGIARTDFVWRDIEVSRGLYNFSTYDGLTNAMLAAGIRPMYILDYSNPIYEPPVTTGVILTSTINPPPIHAASIAAYANFAAAAAARYKGQGVIWEIWNEPNAQFFWQTGPNDTQYADMAISACWAIRNADPDATIIGPSVVGYDVNYIKDVFSRGLLECLDGVSFHPYRGTAPETVQADYDALKALIAQYASPTRAKQIAIVNSEWGYTTALTSIVSYGVGYVQQADYIARQKLIDMSNGLGASVWYDWKNDGIDPTSGEDNFGIVDANDYAKLAYTSHSNLYHQIQGMSFIGKLAMPNANDYAFVFGNAQGVQCIVSWTTGLVHSLTLTPRLLLQTVPTNFALLGVNINNQLATLNVPLTLTLSGTPQYVKLQLNKN